MSRIGYRLAGAGLVVLVIVVAACARASVGNAEGKGSSKPRFSYPLISVDATHGPRFAFREYPVPGSVQVADYDDRYALLVRNTMREFPNNEIRLLDLATGRDRAVLSAPISLRERFEVLGYALGPGMLAWEEVAPGEVDTKAGVGWRLYTAKIATAPATLLDITLVDQGSLKKRTRPLFHFDGSRLVWVTNDWVATQHSREATGRIRLRDVRSGIVRVVATLKNGVGAFCLSEGRALITRYVDTTGTAASIEVVDLSDGRSRPLLTTGDGGSISHFPQYHEGWLAWSAFSVDGATWPDQYLRDPAGTTVGVGKDSMDGCFVGDYLFFESNPASGSDSTETNKREIWGMRPGAPGKFLVIASVYAKQGAWETVMGAGYRRRSFLVFSDLTPWVAGRQGQRTLIRLYDVGPRKTG